MRAAAAILAWMLVAGCGSTGSQDAADAGSEGGEAGHGGGAGGGGSGAVPAAVRGYVRGDDFTRLVLEVDFVAEAGPRVPVVEEVAASLAELVDKPDGVEVVVDQQLSPRGADHRWSFTELRQLANEQYDLGVPTNTTKIHVLYVDGQYDDPERTILGLAWDNRHLAIFKETIETNCTQLLALPAFCPAAERTILTHEIGHVIGLVNLGLPMVMNHEDPEHEGHDVNEDCVMFWAYDGESALDFLRERFSNGNEEALSYCQPSLDDIAALRDGS